MARVLVISTNGFSKVNCNKTYESIFKDFKKEELFSLFFRPHDSNIDYDYCSSYYAVSEASIINKLIHPQSSCGGIVNKTTTTFSQELQKDASHRYYSFFKGLDTIKRIRLLRDFLWMTNTWFNDELKAWLRDIHADVIFYHDPGNIGYLHAVKKIGDFLNIPIVYYITDDYYRFYTETVADKLYQKLVFPKCKEIINRASKCYCIGEMMAKEYNMLFGREFSVIMNSTPIFPINLRTNIPKNISYFGGLHLDRWKMIVRFAEIFDGEVNVYTTSEMTREIEKTFAERNVKYRGGVSGDKLTEAMQRSDALLHIESDEKKYMKRTKLAVSTKIPEYMASGRVIIGFGNPDLASMEFISRNNAGLIIDSREKVDKSRMTIKEKLNVENIDLWVTNAFNYAKVYLEENVLSLKFRNDIEDVIACKSFKN